MDQDRYTEAVREAMEHLPVSRRELARRSEVSHTTLNAIANGDQPATADVVVKVVKGLLDLMHSFIKAREALDDVSQAAQREVKRQHKREGTDE